MRVRVGKSAQGDSKLVEDKRVIKEQHWQFAVFFLPGGGGTSKKFVRGCACRTSKFRLSLYLILSPFTTHQYTNFAQNTHFCSNWVLFTVIPPNTPYLCKVGAFICDENPTIAIPKSAKKRPKRQAHIIRIPCQCEYPPGFLVHKLYWEPLIPMQKRKAGAKCGFAGGFQTFS